MVNFDNSPILYFIFAYGIGWIALVLACLPAKLVHNQPWAAFIKNDNFFLAISLLTLFLLRLPSIVFNQEINADESQHITQAMTLLQDPVYFRSVDGTTGGPLSSYLLILPSLVGLPFDYITARLTAFGLIALSFSLLFYAARSAFGQRPARLALIPFVLLLGLSRTRDFVIYGSELLSVATLSWLYYLFITHYKKPGRSYTYTQLIWIGFLCGTVPFEKIQGSFLSLAIGLFIISQLVSSKQLANGEKWRSFFALAGGTLCFPVLFIGWMYSEGLFEDFINFYILDNLSYSIFISDNIAHYQPVTILQKLLGFYNFLISSVEFTWLMALLVGIILVWLFAGIRRHIAQAKQSTLYPFIILLIITAVYSTIHSGTFFAHYLYYLFGPLMLLFAFFFSTIHTSFARIATTSLVAIFMVAFSIRLIFDYKQEYPFNPFSSENQRGWSMPQNNITKTIAKYEHEGEGLAVWGWRIDYYVRLQMPQAVAENHTIRSIKHRTMKALYQKRYVADMLRSLPPVFVDAVGKQDFYFPNRKTQGYEVNEALRQIISAKYTYIGMTDDVRIFVRNDRYVEITNGKLPAKDPLAKLINLDFKPNTSKSRPY